MLQNVKKFAINHIFDESLFRFAYILSLLLSFVCIIEVPFQVITYTLMLWAIILLIKKRSNFKKIKHLYVLLCFIFFSFVTSLVHIRDHFGMNILMVIHVAICFFLFYGMQSGKQSNEELRNEMYKIFAYIVKISTFLTIVGIFIAIVFAKPIIFEYYLGLRDNRYTGIYTNPNISAFVSVISIIFAQLLINKKQKGVNKPIVKHQILIICIISNFLALLLSDSNASLLFLLVYCSVFIIFTFINKHNKDSLGKFIIGLMCSILICILIAIATIGLRLSCQHITANFMNNIHDIDYVISETGNDSSELISIGRDDSDDASSGRLELLNKAFVIYKKNPFIGIGKENIVEYGNRYLAKGFGYSDLHNGYLTILISCGAIGLILFLYFSFLVARDIFKALFEHMKNSNSNTFIILVSTICAYCAYSFLEKALLFDITFMVVIFWLILGYAMTYVYEDVHENQFTYVSYN